jgi:hypothetical protein
MSRTINTQLKIIRSLLGLVFLGCFLAMSWASDHKQPSFTFGGKQLHIGMPKREALALLSECCKLSPPGESEVEKQPAPEGMLLGHFILSKQDSVQGILGTISFYGGSVLRITRPLDVEVDSSNDDVVGFARAIKRSLLAETDTETGVIVSIRHERMSNAESDVVLFSLPNGRGIEMHIGTLDKPNVLTNRRDFVTLDEILEPARQK